MSDGQQVFLGLRPEAISIAADGWDGDIKGVVRHVERLGESSLVHTDLDETATVVLRDYTDASLNPGETIGMRIDWTHALYFDESGRALPSTAGQGERSA